LNDVYELEIGKFMYNYVHRNLPHYLSDIFTFTHDIHIHETRQASHIHIRPFTSLTVKSSNSFLCKGPLIWNRIPLTIQQKKQYKKFCCITKSNCCKRVWRASWSLFNIKYLFIYVCNYILVIVGSWYYHTFAIHVSWTFLIEY
jgi:hypothetical protein